MLCATATESSTKQCLRVAYHETEEHCLIEDDQTVAHDLDPHRKKLTASPREDRQARVDSRRARSRINVAYIERSSAPRNKVTMEQAVEKRGLARLVPTEIKNRLQSQAVRRACPLS